MSQLKKHLKYRFRHHLRGLIYSKKLGYLGPNVFIDDNVKFLRFPKNIKIDQDTIIKEGARLCSCNETAQIKIGKRTTIGYHVFIFSSNDIKIGNDCLIAPYVYIVDSDHGTKKEELINKQSNITAPIIIGNDVWLASNVTILKGVSIGDGAIVAGNSLVNKNIGKNEIWAGSPAIKIGMRE